MLSRDFVFWLNGFFELSGSDKLTDDQVVVIKQHLVLVFQNDPQFKPAMHGPTPPRDWDGRKGTGAMLIC